MADYRSRHPSNLEGASVKAEMLWNEWFTVNSVNSLFDVLGSSAKVSGRSEAAETNDEKASVNHGNEAKSKQPIKSQEQRKSRKTSEISCSVNKLKARMDQSPSIRTLNEKLLPANYAVDKTIQKFIAIVKSYNRTAVSRLPSPWREKFQSFSLDERGFLYMDNRLVIPQATGAMIMCSLHYGHPGRDAMLGMISDIWWLKIHREVIDQARLCEQCLKAGKNLKCILKQKQVGKLPEVKEMNEEVALNFAGPFQNAKQEKSTC